MPWSASATAFAGSARVARPCRPASRRACAPSAARRRAAPAAARAASSVARPRPRPRREGHRRRPVGTGVGHRQHHAHERDAVGVAVVDAARSARCRRRSCRRGGTATAGAPDRAAWLARRDTSVLQLARGRRGAGSAVCTTCRSMSKCRSVSQNAMPATSTGALAEALEHQEALLDHAAQARRATPLAEQQHAADHHEVVRAVHAQPRGVDRGHLFASGGGHRAMRAVSGCGRDASRCARLCVRAKVARNAESRRSAREEPTHGGRTQEGRPQGPVRSGRRGREADEEEARQRDAAQALLVLQAGDRGRRRRASARAASISSAAPSTTPGRSSRAWPRTRR